MRRPGPDSPEHIAFTTGVKETRETLGMWKSQHFRILIPWGLVSLAVALIMFAGAWGVATWVPQPEYDFTPIFASKNPTWSDTIWVFWKNSMVLLLHLLVCVAAYLARRAVPMQAKHLQGVNRWVHHHAGGLAMAVVAGLTAYSLCWQTWQLGCDLHAAARTLGMSPIGLLVRASLHGIPELTAIFLPLAACLMLGRKGQWNQLAAAAVLCTFVSLPVIFIAAVIETWVTHGLF